MANDKFKHKLLKPGKAGKGGAGAATAAGVLTGILALAASIIKPWEGKRNAVYLDIVGVPTVCYGQTGKDIRPGQRYTDAECEAMLQRALPAYYADVKRCIVDRAPFALTVNEQAALTSFVYNVGAGGVCGSGVQRAALRGDRAEMCRQMGRWINAGGRPVRGLQNRRRDEIATCLEGQP